jgi:hypothetical protein
LEKSASIHMNSDNELEDLVAQILTFHVVPKAGRDQSWLVGRRDVLSKLHSLWSREEQLMLSLREMLATQVRAILEIGLPGASQAVVLAEFTNEALERLRAKEQETTASSQGAAAVSATSGVQASSTTSALEKYLDLVVVVVVVVVVAIAVVVVVDKRNSGV